MNRTIRKNSTLVCALLGVMVAGQGMAADLRYKANGDYFSFLAAGNVGANGWFNNGVVPGLPGAADTARFNFASNTVTLAAAAPTITRFQMGVDESGGLIVNSGGTLAATGSSIVGNNAGAAGVNPTTGFLVVNTGGLVTTAGTLKLGGGASAAAGTLKGIVALNGGTLSVGSHLWVGNNNLTLGTLDINSGGILNVGGILGLGTANATSASGGIGLLNINNGGRFNLSNISGGVGQPSIQPGSLLNISGSGFMTLPGDFTSVIANYIASGKIVGDSLVGNVISDLTSNPGFTTVYVPVPEPSSFALLAVAGFGFAFRRRS